ncbi:MAG: rod shape-determining protein MreD [Humibacillus sp.]|nr:rod shape-determining protein MreD [Humibacillus sp.]MDN5777628.1 rod shape-determining protein MreD [Humibacillus sp.]
MRPTTLGLARVAYLLVAALLTATLLPRLGVPGHAMPDLVLIGVVSTAVLRGPLHGAIVGLAAGWVALLIPPVGSPIGLTALVMMTGGAAAGAFRSPSSRSVLRPLAALLVATVVVQAGRLAAAALAEGSAAPAGQLGIVATTMVVGLVALPVFLAADRALVRRRLG